MKLEIFEPALCCATGVCGPEPDQKLIDLQNTINLLGKLQIETKRYAINQAPMEFVRNETVKAYIKEHGPSHLPITLLDGKLIHIKNYPTIETLKDKIPGIADAVQNVVLLAQFS